MPSHHDSRRSPRALSICGNRSGNLPQKVSQVFEFIGLAGGEGAAGFEPSLGRPGLFSGVGLIVARIHRAMADSAASTGLCVHDARVHPQVTVRLWALTSTGPDGPERV